ncbi:hypothetical protein D3C81_1385340 [compost metagenome]
MRTLDEHQYFIGGTRDASNLSKSSVPAAHYDHGCRRCSIRGWQSLGSRFVGTLLTLLRVVRSAGRIRIVYDRSRQSWRKHGIGQPLFRFAKQGLEIRIDRGRPRGLAPGGKGRRDPNLQPRPRRTAASQQRPVRIQSQSGRCHIAARRQRFGAGHLQNRVNLGPG